MVKIDRVSINKEDKKKYEELQESEESSLLDFQNKTLYLLAFSLGVKHDIKPELKSKKGFARLSTFTEEDKALIKSLVVEESNNLEVLDNKAQVYEIADRYAAGGIRFLYDEVFSDGPGEHSKKIEEELVELAEDFGENN